MWLFPCVTVATCLRGNVPGLRAWQACCFPAWHVQKIAKKTKTKNPQSRGALTSANEAASTKSVGGDDDAGTNLWPKWHHGRTYQFRCNVTVKVKFA